VVVSAPSKVRAIPIDVIQVVPIAKTALKGVPFPTLAAGSGSLPLESTALVYQLMVLDTTRVTGTLGTLTIEQYAPILEGVKAMLELEEWIDNKIPSNLVCSRVLQLVRATHYFCGAPDRTRTCGHRVRRSQNAILAQTRSSLVACYTGFLKRVILARTCKYRLYRQ